MWRKGKKDLQIDGLCCCFSILNRVIQVMLAVLLFSASAPAATCADYQAPGGEEIGIETEAAMTYISAPSMLDGEPLHDLSLWIYPVVAGNPEELSAPLAFRIEEGVAKSFFRSAAMSAEFEVHARYGEQACGPQLGVRFSIAQP